MNNNTRRVNQLNRRDYFRRLAAMKEPQQKPECRAWIAKFEGRWHWSSPSNLQLPNPFRN